MRKNQIDTGVIYARHDSWGAPRAVRFLSADLYQIGRYDHRRSQAPPGTRPGRRSYSSEAGYLALVTGSGPSVIPEGGRKPDLDDKLAVMKAADPAAEITRWLAGEKPSGAPNVAFELVGSLARVNGEYEAEMAAYRRRQEESARSRADAAALRNSNMVRAGAALNALKAAVAKATGGREELRAWRADQQTVVLYVEDVELITGLITPGGDES